LKKRVIWGLVLALLFGSVGVFPVSAAIGDVPTDHWAYQAVATLVNKGYLAVYEDGTFQGTRAVDRYTLAVTLARILDEIEAGRIQGSVDDLSLIRELTTEFREELVKWYSDREGVEEKLAETQRAGQVAEERVNRVVSATVTLEEEVEQIKENLKEEAAQRDRALAEQGTKLGEQKLLIEDSLAQIARQQEKLGELQEAIVRMESRFRTQENSLGSLENWAGEKGAVFAAMQAQDAQLQARTDELNKQIADLQGELDALGDTLGTDYSSLETRIDELVSAKANTDGEFLRILETNRNQIDQLTTRNQELEKDLQNLAVRLQRETQARGELTSQLQSEIAAMRQNVQKDITALEQQIGFSEEELAALNKQIKDEIGLQINAALIREQRLERQLKELQDEFSSFKTSMEEENKSIKGSATIAMVVAAVGILVGFIK